MNQRALAVMLVLVAGGLWWVLRDDAQAQVRQAHQELASLISKTADEGGGASILIARGLRNLLAPECQVFGDAEGLRGEYSPEELAGTIVRLRGLFQSIDLTMSELAIEFRDPEHAVARFSATLVALRPAGAVEEYIRERSVITHMYKVEGVWQFSEFRLTTKL